MNDARRSRSRASRWHLPWRRAVTAMRRRRSAWWSGAVRPSRFRRPTREWSERMPLPSSASPVTLKADTSLRVTEPVLDGQGHFDVKGQVIRVWFNEAAVEVASKKSPVALKITPAVAGRTVWTYGSEAEFRAEKPFDPDVTYTLEIPELTSPSGKKLAGGFKGTFTAEPIVEVAGKTIYYVPKAGRLRPVAISPSDDTLLGGTQDVTIVYDQPIDLGPRRPAGDRGPGRQGRSAAAPPSRSQGVRRAEDRPSLHRHRAPRTALEGRREAQRRGQGPAGRRRGAHRLLPHRRADEALRDHLQRRRLRRRRQPDQGRRPARPCACGSRIPSAWATATARSTSASRRCQRTSTCPGGTSSTSPARSIPPRRTRSRPTASTIATAARLRPSRSSSRRGRFPPASRCRKASRCSTKAQRARFPSPRGTSRRVSFSCGRSPRATSLRSARRCTTRTVRPRRPAILWWSRSRRPRSATRSSRRLSISARHLERGRAYVAQVRIAEPVSGAVAPVYGAGTDASRPAIGVLFAAGKDALAAHVHEAGEKAAVQVFRLGTGEPVTGARVTLGASVGTTDAAGSCCSRRRPSWRARRLSSR